MRLEFELPSPTPSNNQLLRMHWARRGRRQKALVKEVWAITTLKVWPKRPPPAFVRVHVARVGRKLLDRDNLYGGAKMLIDCLTACRLIVDDSEQHIALTVDQELGKPSTRVVLETGDVALGDGTGHPYAERTPWSNIS